VPVVRVRQRAGRRVLRRVRAATDAGGRRSGSRFWSIEFVFGNHSFEADRDLDKARSLSAESRHSSW